MASSSDPKIPFVTYDDDPKRPNEYVYVSVDIPALKKVFMKNQTKNAEITLEKKSKSFTLKVSCPTGDHKKPPIKYEYSVTCLPAEIETDERTYWTIKKSGEIMLYLCKCNAASWKPMLKNGLEQAI